MREDIGPWLAAISEQIDAALAAQDHARATSHVRAVRDALERSGERLTVDDLATLLRWGEQLPGWRLPDIGLELAERLAELALPQRAEPPIAPRALALLGLMNVLAGQVPATSADGAEILTLVTQVHGADHALTRELLALGATPGAPLGTGDASVDALKPSELVSLWVLLACESLRGERPANPAWQRAVHHALAQLGLRDVSDRFAPADLARIALQPGLPHLTKFVLVFPDDLRASLLPALVAHLPPPLPLDQLRTLAGWLEVPAPTS